MTTPAMRRLAADLDQLSAAVTDGGWLAAERRCRDWTTGPQSGLSGHDGARVGVSDPTGSQAVDRAPQAAPSPGEMARALMTLARAASTAVELLAAAQPAERPNRRKTLDLQDANGGGRGRCEICDEAGIHPALTVLRPIPQDRETMAEDPDPWHVCESCRSAWRRSGQPRATWRANRIDHLRMGRITHESELTHATQTNIIPI